MYGKDISWPGERIAILSILFILLFSTTVHARLAVSPLSVVLEVTPGGTATSNINVHNTGENPVNINLQLIDWWRTSEGNLQFLAPGSRERSCADWLVYSPSTLSLGAGERRRVSLELSVPEVSSGDHWAMILVVEEPKEPEEDTQVSTRVTVNYAIKILQKDPSINTRDASITNIVTDNFNPLELSITYENTGPIHLQTTGRVEIRNLQGETVKKFEIDKFPTLPGEKHIVTVSSPEESEPLEPGTYYAIVIMDFDGDNLIQGGLPIEIPSSEENKDQQG